MSNEKAVEAAKKAEEALKEVQEAEKALAAAKLKAKVAAEEAKMAGKKEIKEEKKEPLITEVVEVTESKPSSGAGRDLVLDFLQKNAWDLRRTVIGLVDVRFEDDPPRVVCAVVSPEVRLPEFEHKGVKIDCELEVRAAIPAGTVPLGEDGSEDSPYHRSIAGEGAKALGIKDALGPHSATSEGAKKREAYEAWLKRHPGVKVLKG